MSFSSSFLIGMLMVTAAPAGTVQEAIRAASARAQEGDFLGAESYLEEMHGHVEHSSERAALLWEKERLRMIRLDYPYTQETLLEALQERIPGVTASELETWDREGRFDAREIDGMRRYLRPSVSNLLFRYPDVRRRVPRKRSAFDERLVNQTEEIAPTPGRPGLSLAEPRRHRIRMKVTVDEGAVSPGDTVRCWLPFPRSFPFQTDIQLLRSDPAPFWIGEPQSAQRTVYFERRVPDGHSGAGPSFTMEYAFTAYARACRIDPARVTVSVPDSIRVYANEEPPHVVFTPAVREISERAVGGETNPAIIARKLYDLCSERLVYSYAPEYATIRNISQWVCDKGYGDCGQMTLYYMTLCRLNGIPARWQSGWVIYPEVTNLHDWCEIYLHPYGWIPVDISECVSGAHNDRLNAGEKNAVRDFFFGSMDAWRMAANAAHGGRHTPPKQSWRTDPVDSQRGELEANGETIPFDRFRYTLEVLESHPVEAEPPSQ